MSEREVPAEVREIISQYRDKMIEIAAEADDGLMKKYLGGEEISAAEIINGVRAASPPAS